MIRLTTPTSSGYTTNYISRDAIAIVMETGASSQWHGIRSRVKCFDGTVLECNETVHEINRCIEISYTTKNNV